MSQPTGKLMMTVLAAIVIFTSGCYMQAGLYPVASSAAQQPAPAATLKIAGLSSGNISAKLADGEICKGRWKTAPATSSNPMASLWDSVYGQGYYVAHVLGTRAYVDTVLYGSRGTVLTLQMYRPESQEKDEFTPIRGVAKDNHGTVYKVVSG